MKKQELDELSKWFITNNVKVGFGSFKGGVGKSTLALQMAMALDTYVFDLDIYGNMESRYNKVISFEAGEKVTLADESFIADFGGFAHEDQERLIDALDIYVVPFTTDDDCAEKTMDTLVSISDTLTPVVLLANIVEPSDTTKVKEIYESLSGILKYDFYPSYVKKYRSFKTATNQKQSVVKYAMQYTENKNKGFREKQLSPAGEELFRFMLEIKKIVEETK